MGCVAINLGRSERRVLPSISAVILEAKHNTADGLNLCNPMGGMKLGLWRCRLARYSPRMGMLLARLLTIDPTAFSRSPSEFPEVPYGSKSLLKPLWIKFLHIFETKSVLLTTYPQQLIWN